VLREQESNTRAGDWRRAAALEWMLFFMMLWARPEAIAADLSYDLDPRARTETASEQSAQEPLNPAATTAPSDPIAFFKKHLFPYEPIYFIAGTKSPNAKFQISLKYQLFDPDASLGHRVGLLTNLYVAYTQTSLWDWNHASAPFEDTSYKPEFFYAQNIVRPTADDWFRFDAQGGFQHESNGRGGADSRSLNLFYLKPIFVFGKDGGWQLTLAPRAWVYVGDLSDNPDIADYRGHAELNASLGRVQDWQLAALFRIGDTGSHASLQLDLSYRLSAIRCFGMTWYAHAQFFTGYGEDLLFYKKSSDMLRIGFALYR